VGFAHCSKVKTAMRTVSRDIKILLIFAGCI
jgi:hypothetical protein